MDAVINEYKYSSLPELNAVLKLYNVTADRGKEDGVIYKKHGLFYRVLDDRGNKIGVPVKASSVYSKPTLKLLEEKFEANAALKVMHKKHLKTAIDWIMIKPPKTLEAFKAALEKEKISVVTRQNEQGIIYGLTYVDHSTKCIFNGSDIGKAYSKQGILEKLNVTNAVMSENLKDNKAQVDLNKVSHQGLEQNNIPAENKAAAKIIDPLMAQITQGSSMPYELNEKKRKKKRKWF